MWTGTGIQKNAAGPHRTLTSKEKNTKVQNTFIQRRTMLLSEVHRGLVMGAARGGMCKDQERQSQAKASRCLKRSDL